MLVFDNTQISREGFSLFASYSIPAGSKLALIGPSGAGKSSLIEALGGFLKLQEGRILWDGIEIQNLAPKDRPVSILFQTGNLFDHLPVIRSLELATPPNWRNRSKRQKKIHELLEKLGISGLEHRLPSEISGGQRARAALARALLQDRPVLVLDEAFGALGPALREEMLNLVEREAEHQGLTLLMVTHNPEEAFRLCQYASIVANGKVEPPLPIDTLMASPSKAFQSYLGQKLKL